MRSNKKRRFTNCILSPLVVPIATFLLSLPSSMFAAVIDVPFGTVMVGGKAYYLNFTYDDGPSADHTFNKLAPLMTFTTQGQAEAARQAIIDRYLPNGLPGTTPPMAYQGFYIPYEASATHFSHVIAYDISADNQWDSWDLGHHEGIGRNDSVRVAIAEFIPAAPFPTGIWLLLLAMDEAEGAPDMESIKWINTSSLQKHMNLFLCCHHKFFVRIRRISPADCSDSRLRGNDMC